MLSGMGWRQTHEAKTRRAQKETVGRLYTALSYSVCTELSAHLMIYVLFFLFLILLTFTNLTFW